MIGYLLWAVFALVGFAIGWLARGRVFELAHPELIQEPTKPRQRREIRRPLKRETVTAHAGPSPFRVVLLDGEVVYDGVGGGEARRHIERLKTQDVEWRAYRAGIAWDWGPR